MGIIETYGFKLNILPKYIYFDTALKKGCKIFTEKFLSLASEHICLLYTNLIEKLLTTFDNGMVALLYIDQVVDESNKYSKYQMFKKWLPSSCYRQLYLFCNNAISRKSFWGEHPCIKYLKGLEYLNWVKKQREKGCLIAYKALISIVHIQEETPPVIISKYLREAVVPEKYYPPKSIGFSILLNF